MTPPQEIGWRSRPRRSLTVPWMAMARQKTGKRRRAGPARRAPRHRPPGRRCRAPAPRSSGSRPRRPGDGRGTGRSGPRPGGPRNRRQRPDLRRKRAALPGRFMQGRGIERRNLPQQRFAIGLPNRTLAHAVLPGSADDLSARRQAITRRKDCRQSSHHCAWVHSSDRAERSGQVVEIQASLWRGLVPLIVLR